MRYSISLAVCSALVLGACGGSSAGESTRDAGKAQAFRGIPKIIPVTGKRPNEGRPVKWTVLGTPEEHAVRIGTGFLSWCVGSPRLKPKIVAVHERRRRDGTVFTVYVVGGYRPGCAEVAVRPEVVIRLNQPLEARKLYDGSESPPIKRWPK